MARSIKKNIEWFASSQGQYQSLAEIAAATIRLLLKNAGIDFVDIQHRAKSLKSFEEKIKRKRYLDPRSEMMDLAGVRVITYIESDVSRAAELIKSAFNVHPDESGDKSAQLGEDRFGYRSVHFVCDIGEQRAAMAEFAPYRGLVFEIQVRTALQHTWAEIEHDRSYKFSGVLPQALKRRFHLVAGLLELADREFSTLTEEIDKYSQEVHRKADAGNFEIDLNSTSITEYLRIKLPGSPLAGNPSSARVDEQIIEELVMMDVKNLSDLEKLITPEFLEAENKHSSFTTAAGLLRDAMMYYDIKKYFIEAWRDSWQVIDRDAAELLYEKYGYEIVDDIFDMNEIEIGDEE